MSWIEVHDTLREHYKTYALAEALNIEQFAAVGLVTCLWTWAINHAPDGDLGRFPIAAIASACHWRKRAAVLLDALTESGFITEDRMIHNWELYAGKLIEQREIQREQSRIRQQRRREKIAGMEPGLDSVTSRANHADVTRNKGRDVTQVSRVNNEVTAPNLTVPNLTSPSGRGLRAREARSAPSKPEKRKYGEYENVLLTDDEFEKLKNEFPRDWQQRIDNLSEYIASKGDKYKSHLATIRSWARRDKEQPQAGNVRKLSFQNYDQEQTDQQYSSIDILAEVRKKYDDSNQEAMV